MNTRDWRINAEEIVVAKGDSIVTKNTEDIMNIDWEAEYQASRGMRNNAGNGDIMPSNLGPIVDTMHG